MKNIQFLAVIFFIGLTGFAQELINIRIKENKVPCSGVAPMECLQVQIGKSKEWTYFYDTIDGFDYEPGFSYKLKVEKIKKANPIPADASAYKYKLKKVVTKKKVKNNKVSNIEKLDIYGKKMILTQLNGKMITNENVYFEIDKLNKKIFGKSGVNRFNSSFDFNNNHLIVSPGIGTLMSGDPQEMQLENEFMKALLIPFKVEQTGNTIKFLDSRNNKTVMVFIAPTTNNIWTFINGKEWKLIMLENVSRDFGSASLRFNLADNRFNGNNGCNKIFGQFVTSDETITFKDVATTRMACSGTEVLETEKKMMQFLNAGTLRFDVAEQVLNFYKEDRLVMMFALQQ